LVGRTATASNWEVVANGTFAEEGSFTANVLVTDIGGSTVTDSNTTLDIALPASGIPVTATEDTLFFLPVATFHDNGATAGDLNFYQTQISWGDGTGISTGSVSYTGGGNFTVYGLHSYAEDDGQGNGGNPYLITVTIVDTNPTDNPNNLTTVTTTATIGDGLVDTTPLNNVVNATEGNAFSNQVLMTFSVADPSAPSTDFTVTSVSYSGAPDFLTGPTYTVQLVSRTATASNWAVLVSGTIAEEGSYTATATVTDAGGSSVSDSRTTIDVVDAALTDTTLPNSLVNAVEGNAFSSQILMTFTDANPSAPTTDFTATASYTNLPTFTVAPTYTVQLVGRTATASTWEVLASGTIAEEGNYTAIVKVTDAGGSTVSDSNTTIVVADASLTDTTPPLNGFFVEEGNIFTGPQVLMTFVDANPGAHASDFTATVNWGGTLIGTPTVTVQKVSSNATSWTGEVLGIATYAEEGTYNVSVTVNDKGGSKVTDNNTVENVVDAPLTDTTPPGSTVNAIEGNAFANVVLATFSDANPFAPTSDYSAAPVVTYTGSPTFLSGPTYSVQLVSRTATASNWEVLASGTIAEEGSYTATVNVSDVDGSTVSDSNTTIVVADAALTDTTPINNALSATEGNAFSNQVLMTFSDANPSAPLSDYTVSSVTYAGAPTFSTGPTYTVQLVNRTTTASNWVVLVSGTIAEEGSYAATVTVTDAGGSSISDSRTTINVADAALTDTTPPNSLVRVATGTPFSNQVLMTFSDANPSAPPGDYTAVVSYTNAPTFTGAPSYTVQLLSRTATASTWEVLASGTIDGEGTYTAMVKVTDAGGSTVSDGNTTIVVGTDLTDTTPMPNPFSATEGNSTGQQTLMTFVSANPNAQVSDFTAIVNWGGTLIGTPTVTVEKVSSNATSWTGEVVGTATYAEEGTYHLSVMLADNAGATLTNNNTVATVADAPLTDTTQVSVVSEVQGVSFSGVVLATFSDANPSAPISDYSATPLVTYSNAPAFSAGPSYVVQLVSRTASASNWEVLASGTFASQGSYTATVTVTDAGGSTVSDSKTTFAVGLFADNFNRGPSTSLGPNWTNRVGTFGINSANQATTTGTGLNLSTANTVAVTNVSEQVDFTLTANSYNAGLVARYTGNGDGSGHMYLGRVLLSAGVYTAQIEVAIGGVFTVIGSAAKLPGFSGSGTLRFDVVGNSLKLYVNGVLELAVNNNSITGAGLFGMRGRGTAALPTTFDNFSAVTVTSQTTTLPFSDSFVQPDNSTLSPLWTEQVGAFPILSEAATAFSTNGSNAGLALATVNAAPVADVTVQTNFTLTGNTSTAGLIARYSGSGDGNGKMYVARIILNGGVYTAQIDYVSGGTFHTLVSKTLTSVTGNHTLRFQVVGNSLQLFLDNLSSPLLSTTNSSITAAGLVGIRGKQASFNGFSAQ
jgi:hypothetical protein